DSKGPKATDPSQGIPVDLLSQRAVLTLPTAAASSGQPPGQPYVQLEVGGVFVSMWANLQKGKASPECAFEIAPLATSGPGQNLCDTIGLTTGLQSGTSELTITAPSDNPAILQVGTATFAGIATLPPTQVTLDGGEPQSVTA